MQTIYSEKLPRILKNKKRLERILRVKISNRGKEVSISGDAEDEYIAVKVIDAINLGFPFSAAASIKEKNLSFEVLNIKNYTKRKDLKSVRARIIGKSGKTLKTLSELTDCYLELNENKLGVIGNPENMKTAESAIKSLVGGAKQSHVYAFLEKHRPQPVLDLGLKKIKK